MAKRPVKKYDFTPFGKAIKSARNEQKESRNKVGNERQHRTEKYA